MSRNWDKLLSQLIDLFTFVYILLTPIGNIFIVISHNDFIMIETSIYSTTYKFNVPFTTTEIDKSIESATEETKA